VGRGIGGKYFDEEQSNGDHGHHIREGTGRGEIDLEKGRISPPTLLKNGRFWGAS